MIRTFIMAAAAQTPGRFFGKIVLSMGFVAAAALVHREGFALAVLVIFSGITGPAIRIVSLRNSGILDRLVASPSSKSLLALGYTLIWSGAVFCALLPAMAVAAIGLGPQVFLPAGSGTILAAGIGTICGLAAKNLGDVHLLALLCAIPLVASAFAAGPFSLLLPYPSIAGGQVAWFSVLSQLGIVAAVLAVLMGLAARM